MWIPEAEACCCTTLFWRTVFYKRSLQRENRKLLLSYKDIKGLFHSFRRNWATYLYSVLGQLVPSPPHGAARYTHLAAALRVLQVLSFQRWCDFVKQLGWIGTAADLNFADKPFKNTLSASTGCSSWVSSHFQKQSNMHFYQLSIMQTNQMVTISENLA